MFKKNDLLKVIIAALLSGFIAGIIGGFFIGNFYLSRINLSPNGVTITRLEPPSKLEQKVGEVIRNSSLSLVNIYAVKAKTANILNQIYLPTEIAGQGIVLSSDGWILTTESVISKRPREKNYVIMTRDGNIYSPRKIIEDEATSLVFLKIEINNLTASKFGDLEDLVIGEEILLSDFSGRGKIARIERLDNEVISSPRDLVKSSEIFSKRILISDDLDKIFLGSPLINFNGEVIGIVDSLAERTALSVDYFKFIISGILKEGKIHRAYLGVNYIDLSRANGLELKENISNGALIYQNLNLGIRAIKPKSPADVVGLEEGDVVLKVDKENVDRRKDLTEIIQEYQPGVKIELTVLRKGKEIGLRVELGEE